MSHLNLGVIGNCNFGALVDPTGRIVWSCLPHFDGDPVFNNLLNNDPDGAESGFFEITLQGAVEHHQAYFGNTAILVTTMRAEDGSAIRITDFAPRFRQFGRMFRPAAIVRHIEPIAGQPRIRVRVRPTFEYGAESRM